jgi:hypothetical protein
MGIISLLLRGGVSVPVAEDGGLGLLWGMSSSSVGGDGGATAGGGGTPEGLHAPLPSTSLVAVEGGGGGFHDGSGGLKPSPLARGGGELFGLTLKGE